MTKKNIMLASPVLLAVLLFIAPNLPSKAQGVVASKSYETVGILEQVQVASTTDVSNSLVWGMLFDANMQAFDKPIVFRRVNYFSGFGHYYSSAHTYLDELCKYAKLGDLLCVEGRFCELETHYELLSSRITLPNRTVEGILQSMPLPQMSYPFENPTMVACIKDDKGFELALTDAEGNFIEYNGGELEIAGQTYTMSTTLRVKGDVIQGCKLNGYPYFYHIFARSIEPLSMQDLNHSELVDVLCEGGELAISSAKEIDAVSVYCLAGQLRSKSNQVPAGTNYRVELNKGERLLLCISFADGSRFSKLISL